MLLLVSSAAARNHHVSENDQDIFRYPPVIRRSLFFGGLFVVGAGGLVYSTVPPTGASAAPFVIGGLFGGIALVDLYLYLYFSKYVLRVDREGLTVTSIWSVAHMQFSEIRELVVVVGGRLNDRLTLRSSKNTAVRLGGGIQDFSDLVWLKVDRLKVLRFESATNSASGESQLLNSMPSITDPDFGDLVWNTELEWWEGSVKLDVPQPFALYLFSRDDPERGISDEARNAFRRLATMEASARTYAALELTAICNREWSDGKIVTESEFMRRLIPASIEIHEQGYAAFHFKDCGLFAGHGIGVRIKADGTFQEAVVEG